MDRKHKGFKRKATGNQLSNGHRDHAFKGDGYINYEKKEIVSETKKPSTLVGRDYTVSIALPGSILSNAQSLKLKTNLIGQIARAAAIFNIDEIVVYDEYCVSDENDDRKKHVELMIKILEFLECPQYLRKNLFPIHPDLQFAGLLNPLDAIHHLKFNDIDVPYREGIVTERQDRNGSYVYCGFESEVLVDKKLQNGTRVTVEFNVAQLLPSKNRKKVIDGKVVSPSTPRVMSGIYWGYTVRKANSLAEVTSGCTFESGYDLRIGTSENGSRIDETGPTLKNNFKHCLIIFGGQKGLEAAMDSDVAMSKFGEASDAFDHYINVCPNQGSNTIRTEEAILITLSSLRPYLLKHMK